MFPENKLKRWYTNLPSNNKLAFYSTVIIGIICHAFMMTNKWLNLDDIVQLVDYMNRTTSGRWFLMFPSAIGSEFSIPWLNGLLTIIYSAIMSSFIVGMFKVKSKLSTILIGGILVTFPTIASLMPFMNTQDSYQFGAMLAVIAAYLIVKKKNGFIYGGLLLTLSLAIYQTYLGLAGGLILIYVLLDLFRGQKEFNDILILLGKTAIAFIGALAIYLFVSRVIFGHLLVDYKGLDSMGSLPLNQIHTIVFGAYKGMFNFFTGQEFDYHWPFMPYVFIVGFLLFLYLLLFVIIKSRLDTKRKILVGLILLVFPLVINVIYIMSWQAGVMLRMAYAYTVCFIFPLLLIEYIDELSRKLMAADYDDDYADLEFYGYDNNDLFDQDDLVKRKPLVKSKSLANVAVWFLIITSCLSVYNNIYVSNKTYFKVWITNKTSDAYANRIAMRIELTEGYDKFTPVVFLGNPDSRTTFTEEIDTHDTEPMIIANHLTRLYSFKYYPRQFLGLQNTISDQDIIEPEQEYIRDQLEDMPLYPARDSIQMIDGTIYVKFKNIK